MRHRCFRPQCFCPSFERQPNANCRHCDAQDGRRTRSYGCYRKIADREFAARSRVCCQKVKKVEGKEALGPLSLSRRSVPDSFLGLVMSVSAIDGSAGLPSTWITTESLAAGFNRPAKPGDLSQLVPVLGGASQCDPILQVR